MGIEWTAFSWEAFATLVTGLAAVGAAWRVGSRQMAILEQQNSLKEQELRISLLQQRLEVYDAVKAFLDAVCSSSKLPAPDVVLEFKKARTNARFLFSEEINDLLKNISTKSMQLDFFTQKNRNPAYWGSQVTESEAKQALEITAWLLDTLQKLHEKFAETSPELEWTRGNPAP